MKVANLLKVSLAVSLVGLTTACTSMSTMSDARVTEKGKISNAIAFGSIGAKVTASGSSGVSGDVGDTISLPMFEYMLRYGINDDLDFGARTSLWAHGLDIKYALLKGTFALSLGAGLQQMSYEVSSGTSKTKVTSYDFTLPLYLNYEFTPTFVGYLVPKIISRSAKTSGTVSDSQSYTYSGGSIGFSMGQKGFFFVELTVMNTKDPVTSDTVQISQQTLGFRF